MKLSCALIVGLAMVGSGAEDAAALNVPHPLHHSHSSHISETHRAVHHATHAAAAPTATAHKQVAIRAAKVGRLSRIHAAVWWSQSAQQRVHQHQRPGAVDS